jgi:peptidoglycan/LPS O-acetylase OafA/YrhL
VKADFSIVERPDFSALLDHVRWISAFFVVVGHARNNLFVGYDRVREGGPLESLFYLVTNLQNEAVVCFFVISGLLVGGKLLAYGERSDIPVRRYVIDRLARLYVVLIPALALTGGVAALGACERQGPGEWLAALFYLQHLLTPVLACNKPIWSLGNEFWYYVLGLLGLLAWKGGRAAAALAVLVVAGLAAFDTWNSQNVLLSLPFWLSGTAVLWLRRPLLGRGPALIVLGAALALSRSHILDEWFWLRDAFIALGLVLFLLAAAHRPGRGRSPTGAAWGKRLAGFSFTLYLTHWPILQLFIASIGIVIPGRYPFDPAWSASYVLWGAAVLLSVAGAALLARVTEARTGRVRAFLSAHLPGRG